jgi:tetratricopeptide (TPR) repeat protein
MSLRAALAGIALFLAAVSHHHAGVAQPSPASGAPASAGAASVGPAEGGEDSPANAEPLPLPPVPPRIAEGKGYGSADAMAATLAATDGAEAAEHCHALAQVELGNPAAGAALLDRLAATSTASDVSRAVIYGQADQAWTMAGNVAHAYASANQALALSPDDPDLLIDRAIAALGLDRAAQAAEDLSHALEMDPKRADALILRATARRALGHLDDASADIDAAQKLDPDNPDLLLERGIIRQRRGDLAGARADWQHAAELAPDTATGDLAEQNLALLEAGPRQ